MQYDGTNDQHATWIRKQAEALFYNVERTGFNGTWQIIAQYILPTQWREFTTSYTVPGQKRTQRLYDSTAVDANRSLASAIHSTMTNPATKWLRLRFQDPFLNDDNEAVQWLEDCNDIILQYLNESNFNTEVAKSYLQFPAFGNLALLHEEDWTDKKKEKGNGFYFRSIHLSEIVWRENYKGIVDTAFIRYNLKAQQAIEYFGEENVSDQIVNAAENDPNGEYLFYHYIGPRKEYDDREPAPPKRRKYCSTYVEAASSKIVKESGYYEFPIYCVRWETMPDEVYGRGPGEVALPDVRSLNKQSELDLEAAALACRPPIMAEQRNVIGDVNLIPGALTQVRDIDRAPRPWMVVTPQGAIAKTQMLIASIQRIFFIDKLLLPPRQETGEMTAYEVAQRIEQMNRILAPVLNRLNTELLTPLALRCFKILIRQGKMPPLPPILQEMGVNVEVVLVNQLARSQKFEDITSIQSWVQNLSFLSQMKPEVLDYIDSDRIAKYTARVLGVPEIVLTDDKDVKAIREQRAQQQAQAEQLKTAQVLGDVASKVPGAAGGLTSG